MRKLDLFPKSLSNEHIIKTNSGGLLSIISVLFIFYMFFYEFVCYKKTKTKQQIMFKQMKPDVLEFTGCLLIYNKCSNLYFALTNRKRTALVEPLNLSISKEETGTNQCIFRFHFFAPNVPGSFHIGLGDSYSTNVDHNHLWYTISRRNISHSIISFNVGGVFNNSLLNGYNVTLDKEIPYILMYSLQLISKRYNKNDGYDIISTFNKFNLEKAQNSGTPGIFFEWNFTPIGIEINEFREPFINLISHYLRVFGCFFVLIRIADFVMFRIPPLFPFHKS